MCIVFLLVNAHPAARVAVASNRDEFLGRPAREVHVWADGEGGDGGGSGFGGGSGDDFIVAGRDLEAGGTWLGVTRSGRFAVLTNFREAVSARSLSGQVGGKAPSRGDLCTAYLRGTSAPEAFLCALRADGCGKKYAGFNLVVGSVYTSELWYWSNRLPSGQDAPWRLADGVHGLSNGLLGLGDRWPKVDLGVARLEAMCARAWERRRAALVAGDDGNIDGSDGDSSVDARTEAEGTGQSTAGGLLASEVEFMLDEVLGNRTRVTEDSLLPRTGAGISMERVCSSAFVETDWNGATYGTRSSQVIACAAAGAQLCVVEKYLRPRGGWVRHGVRLAHATPPRAQLRPAAPRPLPRALRYEDVSTVVRLVAELAARGVWGNPRARACKGAESPLYVAGGGHSELGALTTNSVVLDMRPYFSAVEVHAAAREVGVGAGARLGEVATALRGTGLAAPVGVHPTVGVGLMLQGGLGRLARTHGLSVDAIAAAEVVTPDGNLRYLRAGSSGISMSAEDDELLWALRGAAPNFAVVTRVVLRCADVSRPVCAVRGAHFFAKDEDGAGGHNSALTLLGSYAAAADALPAVQSIDAIIGRDSRGALGIALQAVSLNADLRFPPEVEALLGVSASMAAAAECAVKCAYDDIPHLTLDGAPVVSDERDLTIEAKGTGAVGSACMARRSSKGDQGADGVLSYVRQRFVAALTPSALAAILDACGAAPTTMCCVMVNHCGGAAREAQADACFAPRDLEHSVVVIALWTDPSSAARAACVAWAEALDTALAPCPAGRYAVDVVPWHLASEHEAADAFGAHAARLRQLKAQLDPLGLLRAVPPLGDGCDAADTPPSRCQRAQLWFGGDAAGGGMVADPRPEGAFT